MNEKQCYSCDEVYKYEDADVFTGCNTVDGQYFEYYATKCPMCGCENSLQNRSFTHSKESETMLAIMMLPL